MKEKQQLKRLNKLSKGPFSLDQFAELRQNIYVDYSRSRDSEETSDEYVSCDCKAQANNKKYQMECRKDQCKSNSHIQRWDFPKTVIQDAGKKGLGLFAAQRIARGTIIGEYTGEIINGDTVEKRLRKHKAFYAMELTHGRFIDATYKGSKMRFVNHSCDPNCETQTWYVGKERVVAIVSIRPIEKNEEITYNYRFEDWGDHRQQCFCGARNCTGWMDGKP